MALILNGTDGLSDVDGSASTPAIRGTDTNTGIFFPAADTIAFAEGGAEVARFDSSGNLGLGVTPSAWGANSQVFQNNGGSLWQFGGSNFYVGQNYYFNGSNRIYSTTAEATEYQQGAGIHRWYTAPSGTAGNSVTLTERMRITNDGFLQFNSGYGSAATAYGCRAWVNFNGTGTPTIRGSGNVSSITDNSQGDFTVNFTNAMPDALYATVAACSTGDSSVETVLNINSQTSGAPVSPTTTTTRMVVSKSGVGRKDPEFVCVSIFR